jgi:hypothetical protein
MRDFDTIYIDGQWATPSGEWADSVGNRGRRRPRLPCRPASVPNLGSNTGV